MAKILFFIYPEEGHLLPTFGMARALQAQGHQITYLGILDLETFVQAQGFQFMPILKHSFPKGTRQQQVVDSLNQEVYLERLGGIRSRLARIGFIRRWYGLDKVIVCERFQQELCHVLLNQDDIQALVREIGPDLLVVDPFLPAAVLMAHQLGIRSVSFAGNFNSPAGSLVPPPTSAIIPKQTLSCRIKTRLTWSSHLFGRDFTFWLIKYDFDENIRKLALRCNYPLNYIEKTVFYPRIRPTIKRPELICCPRDFDFPRTDQEVVYYVESMDLQRQDQTFPWDRVASNIPLLYCTLGSQSHNYTHSQQFYQTIIDTMAHKRDWQAIIAIGNQLHIEDFHSVPPNVLLVNWVPQLEVLKRAAIMITHGGLGTIKECIYSGVPMIVVPVKRDQPGNAARIVYHGLGVMGGYGTLSVERVLSLINIIEKDSSFKMRVEAMGNKFKEVEASQPGLQIINALLPFQGAREHT